MFNLFNKDTDKLSKDTTIKEDTDDLGKDADKLLKEATEKNDAGDLDNAIMLLKKAYEVISEGSMTYRVDTFLRLPLYLQQAKKNDEAWREFNLLLTKGYPNQMNMPELNPMDHSIIYDKMRLFLQRKGENQLAIRYGVFSYLSWAIGLYRQDRRDELENYISRENFDEILRRLLKKAKKENLTRKIIPIVEGQIKQLPNIDFGDLAKLIDGVVCKTNT